MVYSCILTYQFFYLAIVEITHLMKEIIRDLEWFHQFAKKHNITYWLDFSTLLGIYRDQNIIQGKTKGQVSIRSITRPKIINSLERESVKFTWAKNGPENALIHVGTLDIFFWDYVLEDQVYNCRHPKFRKAWFSNSYIRNLKTITFNKKKYSIPNSTESFLQHRYGPKWNQVTKPKLVPEKIQKIVLDLEWFHKFARKNKIRYWLDFGTLLGLYRDGDIIPWDKDCDVGVDVRDKPKIVKLLAEKKIHFTWAKNGPPQSLIHIGKLDIFFWEYNKSKQEYWSEHPWCSKSNFNRSYIEKLDKLTYRSKTYTIPSLTDKFLALRYGPMWKYPDPSVTGKNRENKRL